MIFSLYFFFIESCLSLTAFSQICIVDIVMLLNLLDIYTRKLKIKRILMFCWFQIKLTTTLFIINSTEGNWNIIRLPLLAPKRFLTFSLKMNFQNGCRHIYLLELSSIIMKLRTIWWPQVRPKCKLTRHAQDESVAPWLGKFYFHNIQFFSCQRVSFRTFCSAIR
jgi:hypothetical protein